ncbi:MAG: transcriptional regulator, partial [Prevotella sp.]
AKQHPDQHFLVTRIGCGIAGFSPDEIAPLFAEAAEVENISLPDDFWEEI